MKQVELLANYDARQSFYGKAHIRKGFLKGYPGYYLTSYSTDVAFAFSCYEDEGIGHHVIDPNTLKEINEKHPGWSQTTNRHIRSFCKQWRNGDITRYYDLES